MHRNRWVKPMFDNVPTDVSEEYLSGLAAFVSSEGERTADMGKNDFIYALNQLVGVERIPADDDGRASQKVVPTEEASDEAILTQDDYTNSVFEAEAQAWATELLENSDSGAEDGGEDGE